MVLIILLLTILQILQVLVPVGIIGSFLLAKKKKKKKKRVFSPTPHYYLINSSLETPHCDS